MNVSKGGYHSYLTSTVMCLVPDSRNPTPSLRIGLRLAKEGGYHSYTYTYNNTSYKFVVVILPEGGYHSYIWTFVSSVAQFGS